MVFHDFYTKINFCDMSLLNYKKDIRIYDKNLKKNIVYIN